MDLDILNQAIMNQDWLLVVAGGAAIVLGIVITAMKVMGKSVPILDTVLSMLKGLIGLLPRKPAPKVDPAEQKGIEGVIPVESEKGKK